MINHRQLLYGLRVISYFGIESFRWINKGSFNASLQAKLSDILDTESSMVDCNHDFFSRFGIQPEQIQDYAIDVQEKDEATFDLKNTSEFGNEDERGQLMELIGSDFLYDSDLKWVKLSDNYNQYLAIYNATRYTKGLPHIIDDTTGIYGHIEFVNNYTEVLRTRDDDNDGYIIDEIESSGGGSLNFLGTSISEFGDAMSGPLSQKTISYNGHLNEQYVSLERLNDVTFTIIINNDRKKFVEGVKICVHNSFRETGSSEVTRYDYENSLIADGGEYILPLEIADPPTIFGSNTFERHTTGFRSVITSNELSTYQSVIDLLN